MEEQKLAKFVGQAVTDLGAAMSIRASSNTTNLASTDLSAAGTTRRWGIPVHVVTRRSPHASFGGRRCDRHHPPCLFTDDAASDPDAIAVVTGPHPEQALELVATISRTLEVPVHVVGFAPISGPRLPSDVLEARNAIILARRLDSVLDQQVQWDVLHARRFREALLNYASYNPSHLLVLSHGGFPCRHRCGASQFAGRARTDVLVT